MQSYCAREFALDGTTIVVGRDPACTYVIPGTGVSREHARIILHPTGPVIADNASTFGTRINDLPVLKQVLVDRDEIVIGTARLLVRITDDFLKLEPVVEARDSHSTQRETATTGGRTLIGRDSTCAIRCNHPLVSRFHATITLDSTGSYVLNDRQSANGTWVNGRQTRRRVLTDGDIVQIGPYRFFFDAGELIQADASNRVRIEAFGLNVRRGNVHILRNMSLTVHPGEFTAVLGPSGAGKSTLAYALTGQVPLSGGRIYLNGLPFRAFWAAFRSSVGFVAQNNLLYDDLTVFETFLEQSLIRLPGDSLPAERESRINEVLELLELTPVRNHLVRYLSGGQAKRVHLGIELLASPPLIVLDEPLAGLDSGLVGSFMALFRTICDRGHTILMTTHALEQLDLCDRILFVSDGTVRYAGPPGGLADAFGVGSIPLVYDAVKEQRPSQLSDPAGTGQDDDGGLGEVAMPMRIRRKRGVSWLRQFPMLFRRYVRILHRDWKSLGALLVQPVLIAILLELVFGRDLSYFPLTFYFCLTVSSVWIGGISSVRSIARDSALVARESRAGLSVGAYVAAQVGVNLAVALVQSLLFALCLKANFISFTLDWTILVLLFAGCAGGVLMGLGVSAVSATVTRAVSWLPVIFIPQIFFSGILVPFDRMTAPGRFLSHLTVARSVFALFKKIRILEQVAWNWKDWQGLVVLLSGICIFILAASYRRFGGGRPQSAGE